MTATRGYMSAELPSSTGFFTAALGNEEFANSYESAFSEPLENTTNGKEVADILMERTPSKQNTDLLLPTANSGGYSPYLILSPGLSPVNFNTASSETSNSLLTTAGPSLPPDHTLRYWEGLRDGLQTNFQRLPIVATQQASPPTSGDSPARWKEEEHQQRTQSPLHDYHVMPNEELEGNQDQGQITPPCSEENDQKQLNAPRDVKDNAGPKIRRKRALSVKSQIRNDDQNIGSSAKRQRKSNAHPWAKVENEETIRKGDGSQKRTRFLERNRVAASKCRQKKKEWTNNIEARARELQNEKSQLAMVVGSLRDEMLWLKGELLQHTECGCERIRQYLDTEAANLTAVRPVPAHHRLLCSATSEARKSNPQPVLASNPQSPESKGTTLLAQRCELEDPVVKNVNDSDFTKVESDDEILLASPANLIELTDDQRVYVALSADFSDL